MIDMYAAFTSDSPLLWAVLLAALCVGVLLRVLRKGETLPKPPGPKGFPLVGNVAESMDLNPATFSKWGARWGKHIALLVETLALLIYRGRRCCINYGVRTNDCRLEHLEGSIRPPREAQYYILGSTQSHILYRAHRVEGCSALCTLRRSASRTEAIGP